mmetsp:Transcript_52809/g.150553  ORF Transcript_52809/g.150553 Transcript_52809/m.150553 type:complete len:208 (+) Transcript_52809:609-1232(+)
MIQLRLCLVSARRRHVVLGLDGIVQVGVTVAVPKLAKVRPSPLHPIAVGQQGTLVAAGRGVCRSAPDGVVHHARHHGPADLAPWHLHEGAGGRLVLARPRSAVPAEVEAPRPLRRSRAHVPLLALLQELVLERQERLDALYVAVNLLAQLVSPVAVDAVQAALGVAHIHDVQVLALALDLPPFLLIVTAGMHMSYARFDLHQLVLAL